MPKPSRTAIESENILSDEEVDLLPLDLRCCWHIQPWSTDFNPTSIEHWADVLGWVIFIKPNVEDISQVKMECTISAAQEAQRLKDFLTREFLLVAENLGKNLS